jgi:hypothetical protein
MSSNPESHFLCVALGRVFTSQELSCLLQSGTLLYLLPQTCHEDVHTQTCLEVCAIVSIMSL